jgi:hypothetical protein
VVEQGGLYPIKPEEKEPWTQQRHVHAQDALGPEPKDEVGRRVGSLKPWVFWTIIALVSAVVIAASVGGAIIGSRSAKYSQEIGKVDVSGANPILAL